MKIANERREKPRINLKGTAFVFDRRGRQQVSLRNLSAVGVLVEIPRPPRLKEAVRLGLCLDGKSWLELHGVVRRIAKRRGVAECAIDLRPSGAKLREAIENYVQAVSAALMMSRQRDMLKARLAGSTAPQQPVAASREEFLKSVLPGVVLPPAGARTPPGGVSAADVEAAKRVAAASAEAAKAAPGPAARQMTPAPPKKDADPKMRALYRAAVKDLDGK